MKKIIITLILVLSFCFPFFGTVSSAEETDYYEDGNYGELYDVDDFDTAIIGGADGPQSVYLGGTEDLYNTDYVIDENDLLSDDEEAELESELASYNYAHNVNIVVLTVYSLDGKTAQDYADDYYDYNNYAPDGILLLVSMEERDWHISTKGFAIEAFTDAGIEKMSDDFLPNLSDGNYFDAFKIFASDCNDYLSAYENGTPYDTGNIVYKKTVVDYLKYLAIAVVSGFIISLFPMAKLKKEMNTVNLKANATDYLVNGSMNINESRDMFLYRNVSRVAKPKESSSGGSSTHTSSSGSTHGGGGGKF